MDWWRERMVLNPERKRFTRYFLLIVFCASARWATSDNARENAVPRPAAKAGFTTMTFSGNFTMSSIDLDNKADAEFTWYPFRFFGARGHARGAVLTDAEGNATLGTQTLAVSLATAAPATSSAHWKGTAFGGGGYFEATLRFDPVRTTKAKPTEWPAFWALPIEHAVSTPGEQWRGQPPGYVHFAEPDFFEYDVWPFSPLTSYGGAIHEWYGIFKKTCPDANFCSVSNSGGGQTRFSNFVIHTPPGTDFTTFHRFGFLWVPASGIEHGYAQYYFDDVATADTVTWAAFTGQDPPPGVSPWTFGVLDQEHLVLIVGTGADQPMTVASINVWQRSASENLRAKLEPAKPRQ
jgi:hypothetical protein